MSDIPGMVGDADKKLALQLMLAAAIVMAVLGLLAFLMGGAVYGIIDFAIGAAIAFFARPKAVAGDHATAKMVSLICAAIMGLLGLLALSAAGAAGGLGLLVALIVLGATGGLVYAAMLISPGKKLF